MTQRPYSPRALKLINQITKPTEAELDQVLINRVQEGYNLSHDSASKAVHMTLSRHVRQLVKRLGLPI